jgi:hypothetical protein
VSLIVAIVFSRSALGLQACAVCTSYNFLAFLLHFLVMSTGMRRALLKEMIKSFATGLRLQFEPLSPAQGANYFLAHDYGWTVDTSTALAFYVLDRIAFSLIALCTVPFNLSTGAIPNFPTRIFQLCQIMILLGFINNIVYHWQHSSEAGYPELPVSFLFLNTTVRQLSLNANSTVVFFLLKQLLKSLLQPQYAQLLHPRYKIREEPPLAHALHSPVAQPSSLAQ